MSFVYKLSYLTRERTIEPKSVGKITIAREDGEAFFREKMTGTLEISGDDYQFLADAKTFSVECCQQIYLNIGKRCVNNVFELFWQGYFNMYDIEWDLDNLTATIKKISSNDQYSPIFANYEKEVNWLDGTDPHRPGTPISENAQVLTPFKYKFPTSDDFNPTSSGDHSRARNFNSAIQWLVRVTLSGTAFEGYATSTVDQFSQFLNADINPVTGKTNYLKNVSILHLSDAKRPGASHPATIGTVTLKSVLEDLKRLYNAYWFVDDNGRFRIEHISFFPQYSYTAPDLTLDLTDPKFKDVVAGNLKYSYNSDLLKGVEGIELNISQSVQDTKSEIFEEVSTAVDVSVKEFDAAYMVYAESCIPKDDKGQKTTSYNQVSIFMTNWWAVEFKPDTLPEDGWVLVYTVIDASDSHVPYGWLPVSGFQWPNGNMAMTRLFYEFGRYDSSFLYGILSSEKEKPKVLSTNNTVTERPVRTKTTKNIKSFQSIDIPSCCEDVYDFTGLVKHPLADNCVVTNLEFDLVTETITISPSAPNVCTDIPYPDFEEPIDNGGGTSCQNAGAFIRREVTTEYLPDNAISYRHKEITKTFYADGSCGEYFDTKEEIISIPKRGNGPR